jgi:SnoaL-like domain
MAHVSVLRALFGDINFRDACEWENFESLFHEGAYVYTTFTGRIAVPDFIKVSQQGMDHGTFITHRCHGSATDIQGNRAVTKMKATITQRFTLDQCDVDAEADCRFCFFWEKRNGKWGACYARHWYEKDKLIPVNPTKVPYIDSARLSMYPVGYRFLAYCQEATMPISVKRDMPGHRNASGTVNGDEHDKLYMSVKAWLEGHSIDL